MKSRILAKMNPRPGEVAEATSKEGEKRGLRITHDRTGAALKAKVQYAGEPHWMEYWVSLRAFIWIAVWLCINTGPWVLRYQPGDLLGYLHYFRTLLPFLLFIIAFALAMNQSTAGKVVKGPVMLWMIYAVVGLISGWMSSPRPFDATYWIVIYLTPFAVLSFSLQGTKSLEKAVYLNYLNWIITAAFLTIMLFVARHVLFVETDSGLTGYGVIHRMRSVVDVPMSRSSGMARFASVPAVVAFVFVWGGSGFKRLLWIVPFILSSTLVYLMQSRGAMLGLGFSLGFVMVFLGKRSCIVGALLLVVFGSMLYTEMIPAKEVERIKSRFLRGATSEEKLLEMGGRTFTWNRAWTEIQESPILGYGPQADRRLLGGMHVHNTYLYALLQAGFVGAAAFVGGLVWTWVLFFRAVFTHTADRLGQRRFLIQVGGILIFFTARSIPEVCGAMFGVDLLVMLPILVYLVILDQQRAAFPVRTYGPLPKVLLRNLTRRELPSPFQKGPQYPSKPSKSPRW